MAEYGPTHEQLISAARREVERFAARYAASGSPHDRWYWVKAQARLLKLESRTRR